MAIQDPDTHGYYVVNWKKFHNKTRALMHSTQTGFPIRWYFNDNIYSKINWKTPIQTNIFDLYKQRAKQLREKYDYIILHYSGGQDSNNVLHAFMDNNIHIDEINMQVPEPMRPKAVENSVHFSNYWAEIDFQAIPYLKKFQNQLAKTKITFTDMSQSSVELLNKDNWMEIVLPGANYNLGVLSRNMGKFSETPLKQLDAGKSCCHLMAIDKPLVYYDEAFNRYEAFFVDQNAYHVTPMERNLKDMYQHISTEFFYWTPDMPEIVVKQAQMIKDVCIQNNTVRKMFTRTFKDELGVFRKVMQNIIYNPNHEPWFQTNKPPMSAGPVLNTWFFEGENKRIVNNYNDAIRYLGDTIDNKFFSAGNVNEGYTSIMSKSYEL